VLKLQTLLKNSNFNYKRSKEPIKTLQQANKAFINMRQHKMDLTNYFKKFKARKRVVEELNQSVNGHAVVELVCREQSDSAVGFSKAEKTKCIANGKERTLCM
jgi:hypothetical protein